MRTVHYIFAKTELLMLVDLLQTLEDWIPGAITKSRQQKKVYMTST